MTLARRQMGPIHQVFELTAKQGLTPQGEALPDVPTVADFRRLRHVLMHSWHKLPVADKKTLYQACQQMLTSNIPPIQLLSTLPQSVWAVSKLIRQHGLQGAVQFAREIDVESKAMCQEIVSLWENDHAAFASRFEAAVREAREDRGTRIQNKDELKAILDDLF